MYKADEIAKYILAVAYGNGDVMTNLRLQKLLYYAQAWYVALHEGRRLFSEDIEAWEFGPVVREVYHTYKEYAGMQINDPKDYDTYRTYIGLLKPDDRDFMDELLDKFMDYSASSLVNMIHNEALWRKAYDPEHKSVITTESMHSYYSKL
jgi:uncharacterized phage-associated protein